MALLDDDPLLGPAGYVFQTSVRAKKQKPQAKGGPGRIRLAGTQIGRVTRRRSEVMVKALQAHKQQAAMAPAMVPALTT